MFGGKNNAAIEMRCRCGDRRLYCPVCGHGRFIITDKNYYGNETLICKKCGWRWTTRQSPCRYCGYESPDFIFGEPYFIHL